MTRTLKFLPVLALAVVLFGGAETAHANPSTFAIGTSTSAATSSPSYMTPGTGTTTSPVFDAYAQTMNGGLTTKADYAGLLEQFTGSSTAAVLKRTVEYSQDGIDWYRSFVLAPSQPGTTTAPVNTIGNPFSTSWTFASSSVGGAAPAANNNRATAATVIPTPFRYTRIVYSITGGNGAIFGQLVPIKERP